MIEIRVRPPWLPIVVAGVFGAAMTGVFVVTTRHFGFHPGSLLYVVLTGVCVYGIVKMLRVPTFSVDSDHVRFNDVTVPMSDITGLGAETFQVPSIGLVTRYLAYLNDGRQFIFTDHWEGEVERFAAALQHGSADAGELDREAALRNGPRPSPNEALNVDSDTVRRFVDKVERVYAKAGAPIKVNPARLQARDGGAVREFFSLARQCMALDKKEWSNAIAKHRDAVERAVAESDEMLANPPSLEAVRSRLKNRITLEGGAGAEPLGGGLFRVVVMDSGEAELLVVPGLLAGWGLTSAELFEIAKANFRSGADVVVGVREAVTIFGGTDATAALFCLDLYVECDPELGALVGVAATDWLVAEPIHDFATLLNLITFKFPAMVARASSDAQRPISNGVFWWHDDTLDPVPVVPSADGGQQWVVPPELSTRLTKRMKGE